MASPTCLRTIRRRAALPATLLSILLVGCAKPSRPAQPLVGHWQGMMVTGSVAVPSVWEIRADGTQSLTLTLPQGAMTAQGAWTAQDGVVTQRTTARVVVLGGEQKVVLLASPMETTFAYQLTGDMLTLTRPGTLQPIVLRRDAGKNGK